ncbi:MAG TPA: NUDIX domain-containing protein [Chloroflexia bacterium]|jgi:8-oxo-dGTP pyrophosphatase MutT (NUDIX family)
MSDYEILAIGPFAADSLKADLDDTSRNLLLDDMQQAQANLVWLEHSSRRAKLGLNNNDDVLVRLAAFRVEPDRQELSLALGITSFREFVATRSREAMRGGSWDSLANPLAVAAAVVTADEKILVGPRPNNAHIHPGKYFLVGGFVDRSDLAMPEGLVHAMKREIYEEVGVASSAISDITCTGLNFDLAYPHPELSFSVRITESFATVATHTPQDKDEVLALESIDNTPNGVSSWLRQVYPRSVVGTAVACLLLHGRLTFGERWFHNTREQLSTVTQFTRHDGVLIAARPAVAGPKI